MNLQRVTLLALIAAAACGGDKGKDESNQPSAKGADAQALSPDDYRKKQAAYADSVLNQSAPAKALVEKLGKGYAVGETRLRDTVGMLAADRKTDCFSVGRKTDPYLAGTVSFFVNISVVGSDVVRVQESHWTSAAGNIVDACLNEAAKNWKFDATFGKPAAYIVQVQFK
jgi:hypothetical protein